MAILRESERARSVVPMAQNKPNIGSHGALCPPTANSVPSRVLTASGMGMHPRQKRTSAGEDTCRMGEQGANLFKKSRSYSQMQALGFQSSAGAKFARPEHPK